MKLLPALMLLVAVTAVCEIMLFRAFIKTSPPAAAALEPHLNGAAVEQPAPHTEAAAEEPPPVPEVQERQVLPDIAPPQRFVLITGPPRSGTTWIGKVLATSPTVDNYVHEPMNFPYSAVSPKKCNEFCSKVWCIKPCMLGPSRSSRFVPVKKRCPEIVMRYRSVGPDNVSNPGDPLSEVVFPYTLPLPYAPEHHNNSLFWFHLLTESCGTTILKDPIALFSSSWIKKNLDAQGILVIRHPIPVIRSWIRRSMMVSRDLSSIMDERMQEFPFLDEERRLFHRLRVNKTNTDRLLHAIVMYRITARTVMHLKDSLGWPLVRYEDIVADPEKEFGKMWDSLGLTHGSLTSYQIPAQKMDTVKPKDLFTREKEAVLRHTKDIRERLYPEDFKDMATGMKAHPTHDVDYQ